eukprot:UN29311
MAKKDPRIKYHYHDTSLGQVKLGTVRNELNHLATGEVLVNMDSDDYYHGKYIPHMISHYLSKPGVRLVSLESIIHALINLDGSFRFRYSPYDPNCADGWVIHKSAADLCEYRKNRPANE